MNITNKNKSWIEITDIAVKIPPAGKGSVFIRDEIANKSSQLKSLISSGILSATKSESNNEIVSATVNGSNFYIVPSTDVWDKSKVTYKCSDIKPALDVTVASDDSKKETVKSNENTEKRFTIGRAIDSTVFINGSDIILNKHRDKVTIDAPLYFSENIQKAIESKTIRLLKIEQSVNGNWEEMDCSSASQNSFLASNGQCCAFWEGPLFDGGGYANMNRQYIFNLEDVGACIKPSLISTLMDVEESVKNRILRMSRNMISTRSPKVYATNVPNHHYGRSIAYTMMETENKIHPLLVHKLTIADEIWVPCEWNRQVFASSGVKADMKVMPLGVDSTTYSPKENKILFSSGTKQFVFLSVFNWNWRKGPDVMIKAYSRAFTSNDDVSMVMVSRFVGQKSMSARIFEDISKYISKEKNKNKPHLVLVDNVIPTYMMPMLYNSASACLQISRGEGFGLPACEAVASGVPLLASDHGGHRMFLDSDTASLVKPDRTVLVDKSIEWISPFYKDMEFVDYSDKAIDEVAEKMRWMYDNRETTAVMADNARKRIINEFNWKKCAEKVKSRLDEVQP